MRERAEVLSPPRHGPAPYRPGGRGFRGVTIRDQLRTQLQALVDADGRSLERIGLEAWPHLERRAAGAKIRYALEHGWTRPEVLEALAPVLGFDAAIVLAPRER